MNEVLFWFLVKGAINIPLQFKAWVADMRSYLRVVLFAAAVAVPPAGPAFADETFASAVADGQQTEFPWKSGGDAVLPGEVVSSEEMDDIKGAYWVVYKSSLFVTIKYCYSYSICKSYAKSSSYYFVVTSYTYAKVVACAAYKKYC
jgi:hypothetical protein